MAFTQSQFAYSVTFLGSLAFVLGVIAEHYKPPAGTPIPGKDVVVCKYPSDPSVALGALSIITLLFCSALGLVSIFTPYNGKSVPRQALFSNCTLKAYLYVAVGTTVFAEAMLLWVTISEGLHHSQNVHHDLETDCPTAKTGVFGGGALLALDAALFWLVCQSLTANARSDYLEDEASKCTLKPVVD